MVFFVSAEGGVDFMRMGLMLHADEGIDSMRMEYMGSCA